MTEEQIGVRVIRYVQRQNCEKDVCYPCISELRKTFGDAFPDALEKYGCLRCRLLYLVEVRR